MNAIQSELRIAPRRRRKTARVALVNMPFALADRPSIQCGLLKAGLTRAGHHADVHYLNLDMAAVLGPEVYRKIAAESSTLFLGEWLFTTAAFGHSGDEATYLEAQPDVLSFAQAIGIAFEDLCALRRETIPQLVSDWAAGVDWSQYDVVGFTSMFEQNVAAQALARRIKESTPGAAIVFGGANFDGDMGPEFVRAFPWIDYAVVGEGDEALPELVRRIVAGQDVEGMKGVVFRRGETVVSGGQAPRVHAMDSLPQPDFDEYFTSLRRIGRERVLGLSPPLLLFESARGCWWGQKHHCTFCGLNNNGMAFRSKSIDRVASELQRLSHRYSIANFSAVDNIMDMSYLGGLCDHLIDGKLDYSIFYEVKANLTRAQLQKLSRAGVRGIQPGIESLSTRLLSLMRKGATKLINVRLLKWAHYYGIDVSWNLLTGFPGESEDDYAQQARLLPLLYHLPPPAGCGPIWLERFSPYFFEPGSPVREVRAKKAYSAIYPGTVDVERIAYYFDYRMEDTVPYEATSALRSAVDQWKDAWSTQPLPLLVYQRAPDWIQIIDRRDPGSPRAVSLDGPEALAYELCAETARTARAICAEVQARFGPEFNAERVDAMLHAFAEQGLAVEEDGHFLSLALPANPNW